MKKKKILWLLLLVLLVPKRLYALTGNLNISCSPSSLSAGDTTTCTISGNTSDELVNVDFVTNVGSNIEITSFETTKVCQGNGIASDGAKTLLYGCSPALKENFIVGTLTLKVKEGAPAGEISISLSNVSFGDTSFNNSSVTGANTSISVKKNTNLGNIILSDGTLNPGVVQDNIKFYQAKITSNAFSLELHTKDVSLQDKIVVTDSDGNTINPSSITYSPKNGKMELYVVVDGDNNNKYIIECTKEKAAYDNSLASLTVGGVDVPLTGEEYYEVTLGKSVHFFDVKAKLKDEENFTFADESLFGKNHSLDNEDGSAAILIEVVPKNSSDGFESKSYIVVVSRAGTSSEDKPTPTPTPTPTPGTNSGGNTNTNPKTSTTAEIVVALVLISAFAVSMVLYKKNMEGYN